MRAAAMAALRCAAAAPCAFEIAFEVEAALAGSGDRFIAKHMSSRLAPRSAARKISSRPSDSACSFQPEPAQP